MRKHISPGNYKELFDFDFLTYNPYGHTNIKKNILKEENKALYILFWHAKCILISYYTLVYLKENAFNYLTN